MARFPLLLSDRVPLSEDGIQGVALVGFISFALGRWINAFGKLPLVFVPALTGLSKAHIRVDAKG